MPLYEYHCENCGTFAAFGRISTSAAPAVCPGCGAQARRLISAPALALMRPAAREAARRNERAAHAPTVVRRTCGCTGPHHCGKSEPREARPVSAALASGKANARPWMLGH